jgi:DNA end-binding protein Ku
VTINFGLLSVPVSLYSATESKAAVKFNLLHAGCGGRLRQQYVCENDGAVVKTEERVKGFEFAKDRFVTFSADELKSVEEAGTGAVEIVQFVPASTIDPLFYDKAYLVAPSKGGARAYRLLTQALLDTGRSAIGKYAARGREHIVQLRATAQGLVMQQLLYAPEVRSLSDVSIEDATISEKELFLARALIEQSAADAFTPEQFEDAVEKRLRTAIEQKIAGKEIAVAAPVSSGAASNVVDLAAALEASLAAKGAPLAITAESPAPAKGKKRKAA